MESQPAAPTPAPPSVLDHASHKRTKIVATIGPSSSDPEVLRQMIEAGLDVVRINFSHADRTHLSSLVQTIRDLADEAGKPIGIMGDLRGPRIRVGKMEEGRLELTTGETLRLTPEPVTGRAGRISVSYPDLARVVESGSRILLDDGNLALTVETVTGAGEVDCRVIQGGWLHDRRGVNLPGIRLPMSALTRKDHEDVDLAVELDFDMLALSFVQCGDDVSELKNRLEERGSDMPVIAKIERRGALDGIEGIVKAADGVMVARGDLALEMSLQDVPIAQKRIIEICRLHAKPAITATQMLESMTQHHKPTRAEAADVANAILDGTDAVMLSGESAIGRYPVEAVATMSRIAARTEAAWFCDELPGPAPLPYSRNIGEAVAQATQRLALELDAAAIVAYTSSGSTARRMARHRPSMPILALSASEHARRRLSLVWGVQTSPVPAVQGTAHMVHMALERARSILKVQDGDLVTIAAGTPYGVPGRTNTIKVERVGEVVTGAV